MWGFWRQTLFEGRPAQKEEARYQTLQLRLRFRRPRLAKGLPRGTEMSTRQPRLPPNSPHCSDRELPCRAPLGGAKNSFLEPPKRVLRRYTETFLEPPHLFIFSTQATFLEPSRGTF